MNLPTAEIIAQGEEVLTGQIVDTNSAWLSEQLVHKGFNLVRHTTVGDRIDDLVQVLQDCTQRSDVCISSGGLGPTTDDLTADAVSAAFQCALFEDAVALQQIQTYFSQRQSVMPEINRKQALLPDGAMRLDNTWGTAPGFAMYINQCWLFCVPGVPYEMRQIFQHRITPLLRQHFNQKPAQLVVIRTANIGESEIQQRIQHLELPKSVNLSYRADPWENQTKLLFPNDYPQQSRDEIVNQFASSIGSSVFSIDGIEQPGGGLVEVIGRMLQSDQASVSVIETISAGRIAAHCQAVDWLKQAVVINHEEQLSNQFSIDASEMPDAQKLQQTAIRIAEQTSQQNNSEFVILQLKEPVQNIESDMTVSEQESVVILTVVYEQSGLVKTLQSRLSGSKARQQIRAAVIALDFFRMTLQAYQN
ncbi:MAG: competence/damage-inducible protein A [Gammaproteobacteria bacterium]|nr:competence/damage-inducible protein A [Gammaproteobacteria bacterium]